MGEIRRLLQVELSEVSLDAHKLETLKSIYGSFASFWPYRMPCNNCQASPKVHRAPFFASHGDPNSLFEKPFPIVPRPVASFALVYHFNPDHNLQARICAFSKYLCMQSTCVSTLFVLHRPRVPGYSVCHQAQMPDVPDPESLPDDSQRSGMIRGFNPGDHGLPPGLC